jgi:hypothetical protein
MAIKNVRIPAAMFALILCSAAAHADMIYTYTGNNFNTFDGNSDGLTTGNSITGFIDVSSALGASFNSFNGSNPVPVLLSWSLTDGVHTLSSALSDITSGNISCAGCLNLRTDASGTITNWFFYTTDGSGQVLIASNTGEGLNDGLRGAGPTNDVSSLISHGSAWNSAPTGTWAIAQARLSRATSGKASALQWRHRGRRPCRRWA